MTISEALLLDFDAEAQNTRRILERIPNDPSTTTFRPHEKSMPMGRLAAHVATLPRFGTMILTMPGLALDPSTFPSLVFESSEKLLADFDATSNEARSALAGCSDEQLQQSWKMTFNGATIADAPRAVLYRTMFFNHLIHHRAQLTVYLRLNDVPVPGLYGPSADEK